MRQTELQLKHNIDKLYARWRRADNILTVELRKMIADIGVDYKRELVKECKPHDIVEHLSKKIELRMRKGGREFRIFAPYHIRYLDRGTPRSIRYGEKLELRGDKKYMKRVKALFPTKGSGKLRKKLKPYAEKYGIPVNTLADVLMKRGTKAYRVIKKARAKQNDIFERREQEFLEKIMRLI